MTHELVDELTIEAGELELIRDETGVCVLGSHRAVEQFLTTRGVDSVDMRVQRVGTKVAGGAGAMQAASTAASQSGRWIKLTEQSAQALKDLPPMTGSSSGVARAIVTDKGKIRGVLEFVRTPGSMLCNPAMLAGAAGIMSQMAMQQAMDEITDYLAVIDRKVDAVLRGQKDAALADLVGVVFVIDEAMLIHEQVGFVSETTWSKVQATTATVARTQGYALSQLDALAEQLEGAGKVGELAEALQRAEFDVQQWLAVLAQCFQLQDAIAVLEIDRVLDAAATDPDSVERHRQGLLAARAKRLDVIVQTTQRLLARIDSVVDGANQTRTVFRSPKATGEVVRVSNQIVQDVAAFHAPLGITEERYSRESRRWKSAAAELGAGLLDVGKGHLGTAGRLGEGAMAGARRGVGRFAGRVAESLQRDDDTSGDEGGADSRSR